jgi:hypothetical protein
VSHNECRCDGANRYTNSQNPPPILVHLIKMKNLGQAIEGNILMF